LRCRAGSSLLNTSTLFRFSCRYKYSSGDQVLTLDMSVHGQGLAYCWHV
jgi:hypothetical protein